MKTEISWEVHRYTTGSSKPYRITFPSEAEARFQAMIFAWEGDHHEFTGRVDVVEVKTEFEVLDKLSREILLERLNPARAQSNG